MEQEKRIRSDNYTQHLTQLKNFQLTLYSVPLSSCQTNPHFTHLKSWIMLHIGTGSYQLLAKIHPELFHQEMSVISAIRDENRNAIIPDRFIIIENRRYFLSIKGCGAYEDMFEGGQLTQQSLRNTCRDPNLLPKIKELTNTTGFFMAENWMGESPYGAQGELNANDELEFSTLANPLHINGAYLCPVIAIIRIPEPIETLARKFFWYRTYKKPFYQVIRLVPSKIRLYFESTEVLKHPEQLMDVLGIDTGEELREFELNFIRSGIALLSLFTRSAIIQENTIKGLIYQDVWLDKDAILALDGTIHFADIEGLMYSTVQLADYPNFQEKEWQKLAFEFLFALNNLDKTRRQLENLSLDYTSQRLELANLVQESLETDPIADTTVHDRNLYIKIQWKSLPPIEIPFLEQFH